MCLHCPLINKPLSDNLFAKLSKASSILVELKKYSLHFQALRLVGIKIARAHDAFGIDNISVYIGQTIPEAETLKRLITSTYSVLIVSPSSEVFGVACLLLRDLCRLLCKETTGNDALTRSALCDGTIAYCRGGDLGRLRGRSPKKIKVGGRPMHPSPQYLEK